MRFQLVVEALLVGALLGHIYGVLGALPPGPAERLELAETDNLRLRMTEVRGFTTAGNRVDLSPDADETLVAFLVRVRSLESDLRFWEDVAGGLAGPSSVRLVGYCDSDDCAAKIRDGRVNWPFPILEHAEVVAAQVVVNADRQGEAVSVGRAGPVRWRATGVTSGDVVRELVP